MDAARPIADVKAVGPEAASQEFVPLLPAQVPGAAGGQVGTQGALALLLLLLPGELPEDSSGGLEILRIRDHRVGGGQRFGGDVLGVEVEIIVQRPAAIC